MVGVEVGAGALLRRLGLSWLSRRLARRILPINQVHLTSARGHEVQLALTSSPVHRLDAVGLSHLLAGLDVAQASDVIRSVGPDRARVPSWNHIRKWAADCCRPCPAPSSARVRRDLPLGSAVTHPHLHQAQGWRPRRGRRLAGWRAQRPPAGVS